MGGISPSTLSRLEAGNTPDLETFIKVCRWLGLTVEEFVTGATNEGHEVFVGRRDKIIIDHLRADSTLDSRTTKALVRMVELGYGGEPK